MCLLLVNQLLLYVNQFLQYKIWDYREKAHV